MNITQRFIAATLLAHLLFPVMSCRSNVVEAPRKVVTKKVESGAFKKGMKVRWLYIGSNKTGVVEEVWKKEGLCVVLADHDGLSHVWAMKELEVL